MATETKKPENSRGIPAATFIEGVEAFVKNSGKDVDEIMKELNIMYGKYKFMESQLVHQKRHFLDKIPDMQSALDAIKFLASRRGSEEPITTRFELSDAVYARAVIDETEKVFVWLGANVMLEYTTEEAEALLTKNIASAKQTLASINTDLDFLKDQITVSEVNIARCHNYRVKLRQHKGDASGAGGKP